MTQLMGTTAAFVGTRVGRVTANMVSSLNGVTPAQAKMVAGKLYPASTLPILLQDYLWTRNEMTCPRGAAVGLIAQTLSIFMSTPLVAIATRKGGGVPFIEMDWVHGIEQCLMAMPVAVMAMSFRQAVRSQQANQSLPKSATSYLPMVKLVSILYVCIGLLAYCHLFIGTDQAWTTIPFLGGFLDNTLPSALQTSSEGGSSFAVWIPHWTMAIDMATQFWYMFKWADCSGIRQWKNLALLHFPNAIVMATVMINHFHHDHIPMLKLLHPMFVLLGSITTLIGSFRVARANGWARDESEESKMKNTMDTIITKTTKEDGTYSNWDYFYSLNVFGMAALLSYLTLCLAR